MDSTIAAAIISAIAVMAAAIWPSISKNINFSTISGQRRKQLEGSWQGTTSQKRGPEGDPIEVELFLEIKLSWRRIKTEALVRGGGTEIKTVGSGGFLWGDYFQVNYRGSNAAIINFGTLILRLHSHGRGLSGRLLGYGSESEDLVYGKVALRKVTSGP